jgi:hypothetical protein
MKRWDWSIDYRPLNREPNEDPADWECSLRLMDDEKIVKVVYVVFTGTIDDADIVTPDPELEVITRMKAMANGLNQMEND